MTRYAATTEVPSDRSRAEIESTLARYGATSFAYGWDAESAAIQFDTDARRVKFHLPLPRRDDRAFTHHSRGERTETQAEKAYEQAVRQRWRALALVIKAKLEAVDSGITTFEEEFMAHIVLPNGRTIGEVMTPEIERAYTTGKMPALLPGGK